MEIISKETSRDTKYKLQQANSISAAHAMGKLPPQAVDLEEAVLGAVLLEKDALMLILDVLKPESFYKDAHQCIYRAAINLTNNNEPVDILTVTEELRKTGELEISGGAYAVARLTSKVSSSAHIEYHARIIAEKHIQRELIKVSSGVMRDAYEDSTDAFELLDKSQDQLFKLSEGNINKNVESVRDLVAKAIKEIQEKSKNQDGLTGVPSSFTALDRVTGGWQRSTLNIIAARPGHGKTAFALALARNAAVDYKIPVAFFSLEMDSLQLVMRLVSSETELDSTRMQRGMLLKDEWSRLHSKINDLYQAPLYIDDTPGLSIAQFRAKTRRLKHEKGIKLIIIDYLQLMTVAGEDKMVREQVISTISRTLKLISKELEIPIIALAQVSREMEKRGGKHRPMLSDLRESGAIEQDADMVMFVWRKEKLGLEFEEDGSSTKGKAEIIIAKHRNGGLEDIPLRFVENLAKFVEWNDYPSITEEVPFGKPMTNSFKPNENFDQTNGENAGGRTMQSKMNNEDDLDDFTRPNTFGDEAPF